MNLALPLFSDPPVVDSSLGELAGPWVKSIPLSLLAPGQIGRIVGFDLPLEQRTRLLEMGLTPGAEVLLIRFAPLGGPVAMKVRNCRLALRRREASGIRVVLL